MWWTVVHCRQFGSNARPKFWTHPPNPGVKRLCYLNGGTVSNVGCLTQPCSIPGERGVNERQLKLPVLLCSPLAQFTRPSIARWKNEGALSHEWVLNIWIQIPELLYLSFLSLNAIGITFILNVFIVCDLHKFSELKNRTLLVVSSHSGVVFFCLSTDVETAIL